MKKSKLTKLVGTLLLGTTIMTFASPIVANAAWWNKDSTGWWYSYGSSWAIGWREIDGKWYYFDKNGYMKTGWLQDRGTWYFLDKSGAMKTGWLKDDDGYTWYYLNSSGAMQVGWVKVNNEWYYMNKSGAMERGWIVENNKHYFLNEYTGAMVTGWYLHHQSAHYYFDNSGQSASGWTTINGKKYYFEDYANGYRMAQNTVVDGCYLGEDGVLKAGVKAKVTTSNQSLDVINNQDSEFIKKIKNECSDLKLVYSNQTTDIRKYLSLLNTSEIMNEGGFISVVKNEKDQKLQYLYVVGMLSGKVYISRFDELKVYEINNNKVVNTFTQNFQDAESNFGTNNWR